MLQHWCRSEKPYPSWTSHSLFVEPAQCLSRHWVTDSVLGRDNLVEQAVREAIESGVLTKTHILNRLGHLLDEPRPARLEPPSALAINDEPIANTERYDHLREVHHAD